MKSQQSYSNQNYQVNSKKDETSSQDAQVNIDNLNQIELQQLSNQNNIDIERNSIPQQSRIQNSQRKQPQNLNALSPELIQAGFKNKVLSIIGIQFSITALFCIAAVVNDDYTRWQRKNLWLVYICVILSVTVLMTLYCFRSVCRQVPQNYFLLFLFTISESYLISYISGFSNPSIVLQAVCLTCLIVFSLLIYAVRTKTDVTQKITFFIYAPFAILGLIIVGVLFRSLLIQMVISLIIIGIFCAYLVFDIQRLQQNKTFSYTVDDYILAALDIYIDIVNIFLEILKILQSK